ncbi:MAG: hypothetical protein DYG89_23935 [Caldilinea sp. CFX5]|nr:hypothetical protein [Caldilinea sp. CFX5]
MNKAALRLLLVFSLMAALIGASSGAAMAQGAFPAYTSGVQVANLEATEANITLSAFNQDGTKNGNDLTDKIPANGSKTYFPISNVSAGFNGSLVFSSDKKIAAISNILAIADGVTGKAAASYVGRDTGATTIRLPLLNKGNSGFNTWFSVQNAGTADANISIDYSDNGIGADVTATIKPGAAKVFYQAQETHTATVFAGTVTSTNNQPLVAAVIQESNAVMFAYTGFTGAGSTAPVFPLINANNANYITGLQIQNAGTQETNVTVSYTPSSAGNACTETQSIAPGASKTFALAAFANSTNPNENCANGARFIGSAKVTTNSANQPLVGIGNQLYPGRNGEAYGSFSADEATAKVVMPLIMDRNGGYYTGFSVQNVGDAATSVSCTFTNSSVTIPATTLQPGGALADLQANKLGDRYVGAATCTATAGGKIVAVVNQLGASTTADQLLVYEGISTQ